MISAGEFKNGITIDIDGKPYQVIEFQHVKPGKGAAFVRTKLKCMFDGKIKEESFNPTKKFPEARIERVDMRYSYRDGDVYVFMTETGEEQREINAAKIEDAMKFVKDYEECKIYSYEGEVFSVEPPLKVELLVTETEPGVKGNTATNVTKPAVVETGATVNVPLFINEGDVIRVSTVTGEYDGKA